MHAFQHVLETISCSGTPRWPDVPSTASAPKALIGYTMYTWNGTGIDHIKRCSQQHNCGCHEANSISWLAMTQCVKKQRCNYLIWTPTFSLLFPAEKKREN
jgi:hypothetical protein